MRLDAGYRSPVVAIVQARMSSTRLPGKVMRNISGKPMLWHVINRLRAARSLDNIVVATSTDPSDDIIARWCEGEGVLTYRGSLGDVLTRYYGAARAYKARTVVRITADCPMIDPLLVDRAVETFLAPLGLEEPPFDYLGLDRTFPDGLDTEVFSFEALERAFIEAALPSEREHVTPYIWKNKETFRVRSLKHYKDLSSMRWSVDNEADLTLVKKIHSAFACPLRVFYMEEILQVIYSNTELLKINSSTKRNEGYLESLKNDASSPGPYNVDTTRRGGPSVMGKG